MFWRSRKKSKEAPAPAPAPSAGGETSADGTQFLTGDSDLDQRTVEVLLSTIAQVSEFQDLEKLLTEIVDQSVELTDAERGFLILLKEGEPEIRVARSKGGLAVTEDVRFSTSIVQKVLDTQQPMLQTVQSDSDALELGRSVFDLKLRAVMCVPLTMSSGEPDESGVAQKSGVLYVDSRAATREFAKRDLSLFAALSKQISIAMTNARLHIDSVEKVHLEQSLELASAIQSGLMPPIPSGLDGLEVHGWYRPAERTSGDFFDFVKARDGRLAAVIGDVTGHGIGPALITATAQASLRSYLRVLPDPASALTMLNTDLCERIDDGMFLTLLLLVLADDGGLEILNAGHHPAIVVRDGELIVHESHGPALGVIAELPYQVEASMQLQTGDVMLAFTDGLIEAHDLSNRDELFGEERVCELLREHAKKGSSAEEITKALAEAALAFSGGSHDDDITLVVVRRT